MEKKGIENMKVDNECGKQEACVSLENQVLLAVNHNNSITSCKRIRCLKRIALSNEDDNCQLFLCLTWGIEQLKKSKDLGSL